MQRVTQCGQYQAWPHPYDCSIPAVGLGTWQSKPNEVRDAVKQALEVGYRHIDARSVYGNEAEVGEDTRASGIDRNDLFITSKLWNADHEPQHVLPALEKTFRDLQTTYRDLYLIHFPVPFPYLSEAFPVNPETEEIWVTDVPLLLWPRDETISELSQGVIKKMRS